MAQKKKHVVPTWALFVGLAIGIAILLRPVALDLWRMYQNSQAIETMTTTYDNAEDADRLALLANARAYNAQLGGYSDPWLGGVGKDGDIEAPDRGVKDLPSVSSDAILPYEKQLHMSDGDSIGWIEAPEASIKQPIYLGATQQTLQAGAGHLEGTSLPVGGYSSRSVITGHSGMQNDRMFDDIRQLKEGDLFAVHILGDTYTYEVTSIETYLPEEVPEHIQIEPGEDLCTLMTCTPYHINSHRLLVTGKRTTRTIDEPTAVQAAANYAMNPRTLPFLIGLLLALIAIIATIIAHHRKKKRERKRQATAFDVPRALPHGVSYPRL